ncbi:uncharacterized protein [Parasteatoda tepidariorum]|uniref:uncharacterized protein n=1 Tax=Parasteatoda tepidariorum TaxID=114398 RepID=UPI001C71CFEF|nr:protein ALP1-like [Parasteatoda tepidariorum]
MDTRFRKAICKEKRIVIALYDLSSSAEYRTVANLFAVSKSIVCKITLEFCKVFVEECGDIIHLSSTEELIDARDAFKDRWVFPQCLGAIDGTHIKIQPPKMHATSYYNYKSFYSIVLIAVVDYNYQFTYVNIGSPGRNNDAFVLQNSAFYNYLTENPLLFKLSETIKECSVPLCFLGDSAFPLLETIQKPYEEHSTMPDILRKYNSSLSRGREIVENAFGRLKARFRILKLLETRIDNAVPVVHAACILNNLCEQFGDYFTPH